MKLEEGKWYRWFHTSHATYHIGKYYNSPDENIVRMSPWLISGDQYKITGSFESKFMQDIVEVTDLTEIRKLLPDGHEDKVIIFKSERYLATMKFFEQLKEPERNEAIENYDENRYGIPSSLGNALSNGFDWGKSKQGYKYWNDIRDSIRNNTYFKELEPEVLVFGKYKIGDIVVSLTSSGTAIRPKGGIFVVTEKSTIDRLYYLDYYSNENPNEWRLATPEEVEAYHNGIKNINDIVKKGDWIVLLKPIQGFDVGKLYLVTDMSGDRLWKIQGINCQIDREYYRKATKEECIINDNRILNLNIKPKDYKEAVNCTTQEEWDFVLSKFNPRGLTTDNFSKNSNNKCIATASSNSEYVGCHSSENYLLTNNYTILTFKEWCDKYGHTYVKEEPISLEGRYIKCLKENSWNDGKTKVGDVLKISKVDKVGDLFIGPYCFSNSRLADGEFELLPIDYSPEPIKEEQTMFKKGDYIVTLINDGDCGKVNYCSKQNEDNEYLCPEIDTKGIKDNGNGIFTFSDKSGFKWRFATKEEGEEYERQGKPYNVTNLLSSLIPNDSSGLITRDVSILSTSTFYGDTPYSYPLTPKEAYPNYSLPVPTNIILKTKTKSKSIKL